MPRKRSGWPLELRCRTSSSPHAARARQKGESGANDLEQPALLQRGDRRPQAALGNGLHCQPRHSTGTRRNRALGEGPWKPCEHRGTCPVHPLPSPLRPGPGEWVAVHGGWRQKPALTNLGHPTLEEQPKTSEDHVFRHFSPQDRNQGNYCNKFLVTRSNHCHG